MADESRWEGRQAWIRVWCCDRCGLTGFVDVFAQIYSIDDPEWTEQLQTMAQHPHDRVSKTCIYKQAYWLDGFEGSENVTKRP